MIFPEICLIEVSLMFSGRSWQKLCTIPQVAAFLSSISTASPILRSRWSGIEYMRGEISGRGIKINAYFFFKGCLFRIEFFSIKSPCLYHFSVF